MRALLALRSRSSIGAIATGAVIVASAVFLIVDVARSDEQRLDDLSRDLAVATLSVGEDTLAPQLALNDFAADMDTILAAINSRSEHFAAGFAQLRELFPDVRALHVATSPGRTVATLGDPALLAPFERSNVSAFCVDGKGYTVVASAIGRRGWVALALDPERSLARARAGARQPVSLALVEVGATDVLAGGRGPGCRPLADPAHRNAATGEYGASLVPRRAGTTAIGYSPVVGTTLSVLIEDHAVYREVATSARRVAILAFGALAWALGYLSWRIGSGQPEDVGWLARPGRWRE